MSTIAEVPHISAVRPNSPPFRKALWDACPIVGDTGNVYSLHDHHQLQPDRVTFEAKVALGRLALYPLAKQDAQAYGLPSCWRFTPDGIIVRRYADAQLHKDSGIDVTSRKFLENLTRIAEEFVAKGLHRFLEFNIMTDFLFPRRKGQITREVTDEVTGFQQVTLVDTPPKILKGDWSAAACFSFATGEPTVAGICAGGPELHEKRENANQGLSDDASSAVLENDDKNDNKKK